MASNAEKGKSDKGAEREELIDDLGYHAGELAALIASIADAMMVVDRDGNITFMNAEARRMFGYAPDDYRKPMAERTRQLRARFPDGTPLRYEDMLAYRALHGETVNNVEMAFHRAGEAPLWIIASAAPIKDHSGTISGAVITLIDNTKRKQAETELRGSRAHINSIFRAAPTGIGLVVDRIITEANDRLCEMTGYAPDELLGKSARILYPADEEYDRVGHDKYELIRQVGTGSVETRWLRKDGRIIDVLLSSTPLDPGNLHAGVTFTALDITERKRAEEALEKYRLFSENTRDIVLFVSCDGRILEANDAALQAYGYAREELLALSIFDLRAGDPQAHVDRQMSHAYAQGILFEAIHRRKDGSTFPVEVSSRGKLIAGQEVLLSVIRDITERKRADEVLRASEERYRAFYENSFEAILITEPNVGIVSANAAACEMFGMTEGELIAGGMAGFVDITDPRLGPALEERNRTGRFKGELNFRRKDGSVFPGEESNVVFTDREGMLRSVMVIRDITERKRAEDDREQLLKQLAGSQKRLESVIENLPAGVIIGVAPSCKVILSNRQCEKILGHPNLTPDTIGDYIGYAGFHHDGKRILPEEWPLVRSITKGEVVAGEEIIYRRGDGHKRCLLIHASPIYDESGKIAAGVVTFLDITPRKHDEKALAEAKAQAELYVDLLGHDINNFNHAAMGYLELALDTLEAENRLKREDKILIERPLASLQNSSKLIDNVRKLRRLMDDGVKTKPIDLGQILKEIDVEGFKHNGRDIAIVIPAVQHCIVEANELLRDIFVNLITNAVKHSDEERPLSIDVNIERVRENGRAFCRCAVEDNGPGIPDEMKLKLFHRFMRGATRAHGKGLGLYLVRTLVEGYGGRVWVEDRVPGDHTKGSRFVVMLPAVERSNV